MVEKHLDELKTASRAFMSGAKCRSTCSLQLLKNVEYCTVFLS